ncbi:PPOX class F420-dependent oxidoreductase [Mycobacterium sp. M1]|uniref:PPOX class F420-dependent oxidoreductase n=1 Tax=Mycolicibacter acidiphilus TaxID=2835306 RepID=A0ABS5RKC8_9MYCO|nr:PPOX class F420-dependent oxidoreductase [Mycolicibacter acidiphilus]MBS9533389.1 PPOX class F420-dependent oxidoreductase [Mycolicibacter acidiphilus]
MTHVLYDRMRDRAAWSVADAETTAGFGLLAGKYALLISYRRTGEGVPSPVWFGRDERDRVYFTTGGAAAKVKRIRNNPRVRLAPCDLRGKPTGPPAVGIARILAPEESEYAEQVIAANYGLGRRAYLGAGRMLTEDTVYVEVTPTP